MKRIILCIVLLITTAMLSFSKTREDYRRHLDWNRPEISIIAYGGYNFLEKAPLVGGSVAIDINFIRAELECGWSYVMAPQHRDFTYFAPSLGFVFGHKSQVYLMGGCSGWPFLLKKEVSGCANDKFDTSLLHFQVQLGTNIALGRNVFAHIRATYVVPRKNENVNINYQNLALKVGLGYWF